MTPSSKRRTDGEAPAWASIDWDVLLRRLSFPDVKVLECLYPLGKGAEPIYVFPLMLRRLQRFNISKWQLWRRLHKFDRMGLVRVARRSSPLVVFTVPEIERNVRNLIMLSRVRLGLAWQKAPEVGRPRREDLKLTIWGLVKEFGCLTPEGIRKTIVARYGETPSWMTVRKYVAELVSEGKVAQHTVTEREGNAISVVLPG